MVKTDGLAAGKGVLVTESLPEAEADIDAKLSGDAFGDAGRRVVVEEGLTGPECSLLVLCDGRRLAALAPAQDFKRRDDLDGGPNTGGMGAYSPVPGVDDGLVDRLVDQAVAPLVAAMVRRGIDYRGVLYAGLMLTPDGPKVLEFNVRFGDPETQVVLPRLDGDLAGTAGRGGLGLAPDPAPLHRGRRGVRGDGLRGLSRGLPHRRPHRRPRRRRPPGGGHRLPRRHGTVRYGLGTGAVVTSGGRVLGVTGLGPTLEEARSRAYRGVAAISWPGAHVRTDIARGAAVPVGAGRLVGSPVEEGVR